MHASLITGTPLGSSHLPPPSLSQEALYSYHSISPPFTQEDHSQSQANNVTVLAPDSEAATTQHLQRAKQEVNTRNSTTEQRVATTSVVDDTVIHSARKKAHTSDSKPTIKSLFDPDVGHLSFPPVEVRSKLGNRPLSMSTQAEDEKDKEGQTRASSSAFKSPKRPAMKSEFSLVEDSHPDSEAPNKTVLPGLRTLSQDTSVANRTGLAAPTPQSLETNPSQDVSVLVPSSLTPRSQEDNKSALPDTGLISALFKGRRKKRRMVGGEEKEEGGGEISQQGPSQKRQHLEKSGIEEKSPLTEGTGGGRSLRGRNEQLGHCLMDTAPSVTNKPTSSGNPDESHSKFGDIAPMHTTPSTPVTPALEDEDQMTVEHLPSRPNTATDTSTTHANSEGFKTPKTKRQITMSSSTFLSARKRKQTPGGEAITDTVGTSGSPSTGSIQILAQTQVTGNTFTLTQTQSTTKTSTTTPFTCLAMPLGTGGGRRTKFQDAGQNGTTPSAGVDASRVEDLWNDDSSIAGEGENPLGENRVQWTSLNSSGMYKPVCTEDGFILPREKPKLKVFQWLCQFCLFLSEDA